MDCSSGFEKRISCLSCKSPNTQGETKRFPEGAGQEESPEVRTAMLLLCSACGFLILPVVLWLVSAWKGETCEALSQHGGLQVAAGR